MDHLAAEEELVQEGAEVTLRTNPHLPGLFHHRQCRVDRVLLLGKISGLHPRAHSHRAGEWREFTRDRPDQRRLAGPVRSEQRHLFPVANLERDSRQDRMVWISERGVLDRDDIPRTAGGGGEFDVQPPLERGFLDVLGGVEKPLQLFLPHHGWAGDFGRLGADGVVDGVGLDRAGVVFGATNVLGDPGDVFLLPLIGGLQFLFLMGLGGDVI